MQMHVHATPLPTEESLVLAKESRPVIQSPLLERERTVVRQDELVAAHVRALIDTGELKPGDRLPWTQAELAELLQVNRNSVFWGMATLRAEGWIIGVQGGRAVVAARPSNADDARPADTDTEDTEPL